MRSRQATGCPRNLIRDETGVIAIIVALSISTFLLGFAALAVDLGTAYVRKAELKSLAEKVAMAGAAALPSITDAVTAATNTLGTGAVGTTPGTGLCADLDLPGVCTAAPGWANDGTAANGEITFYGDQGQTGELADTTGDGQVTTADAISSDPAVGIHVVLPPSTVQFGLAGALGFQSADLSQTATARIGTPLGSGILPFALTPADLTTGRFCVQDPTANGDPAVIPSPYGWVILAAPDTAVSSAGQNVIITLYSFFGLQNNTVKFYFENEPTTAVLGTPVFGGFSVAVPVGIPGTTIKVWATGKNAFGGNFVSTTDNITYQGPAPSDPCSQPQANRGFANLARSTGGDWLEPNIRSGPAVKLYPADGPLGSLGATTALNCLSTSLSTPPASTCLIQDQTDSFSTRMTNGLFTSSGGKPGRLIGDCGAGTDSPHGYGGVDAMRLLDSASPLLDTSFGTSTQLRTSILSGVPPVDKEGWIRSRAFRCPRLAVMPIADTDPLQTVVGARNITGFRYVWIDDSSSSRGFQWAGGNQLRAFRGYVVDPKYFAELVSGSPVVGPYLGPSMPKEVLVIPDLPS